MEPYENLSWQQLCELASHETDGKKLLQMIMQLNRLLRDARPPQQQDDHGSE